MYKGGNIQFLNYLLNFLQSPPEIIYFKNIPAWRLNGAPLSTLELTVTLHWDKILFWHRTIPHCNSPPAAAVE